MSMEHPPGVAITELHFSADIPEKKRDARKLMCAKLAGNIRPFWRSVRWNDKKLMPTLETILPLRYCSSRRSNSTRQGTRVQTYSVLGV
jgi:hypothetical protein